LAEGCLERVFGAVGVGSGCLVQRVFGAGGWSRGCLEQWVPGTGCLEHRVYGVNFLEQDCLEQVVWNRLIGAASGSGCLVVFGAGVWSSGCLEQWVPGTGCFWSNGCLGWVFGVGCLERGVWSGGCFDQWVFGAAGVWTSGCLVLGASWASPLSSEFVADAGETCNGVERVGTEWGPTGGGTT
jgi:hypothetical protein